MSDIAQKAVQILVKGGVKNDFAAQVVKQSGYPPSEILENPAKVLGTYWGENVRIDFLDGDVAVDASGLRQGLTALQLQPSVIDKVCKSKLSHNSESLGHRDVFSWGVMIVEHRLLPPA